MFLNVTACWRSGSLSLKRSTKPQSQIRTATQPKMGQRRWLGSVNPDTSEEQKERRSRRRNPPTTSCLNLPVMSQPTVGLPADSLCCGTKANPGRHATISLKAKSRFIGSTDVSVLVEVLVLIADVLQHVPLLSARRNQTLPAASHSNCYCHSIVSTAAIIIIITLLLYCPLLYFLLALL